MRVEEYLTIGPDFLNCFLVKKPIESFRKKELFHDLKWLNTSFKIVLTNVQLYYDNTWKMEGDIRIKKENKKSFNFKIGGYFLALTFLMCLFHQNPTKGHALAVFLIWTSKQCQVSYLIVLSPLHDHSPQC